MKSVPGYVNTLASALTGGSLTEKDLANVEVAVKRSRGANRQIVSRLADYVRYDAELDAAERASTVEALRKLGANDRQLSKIRSLPATNVDIAHLDLEIDIRKDPIHHEVGLSLSRPAPNIAIVEADSATIAIGSVRVGGQECAYNHRSGRLHIQIPDSVKASDRYRIDISYDVTPTANPVDPGMVEGDGQIRTLTWAENIDRWIPGDNRVGRGVSATIHVYSDPDTVVSASGRPVLRHEGYARFEMERGPFYTASLYAAKGGEILDASGDGRGPFYVSASGDDAMRANRRKYLDVLRHTVGFMNSKFSNSPYGTIDQIAEPTGPFDGMEHADAIHLYSNTAAKPEEAIDVIAHEAIHHWFGDGNWIRTYADLWLSEGVTSYWTYRAKEEREGVQAFSDARAKGCERAVKAIERRNASDQKYPLRPADDLVPGDAVLDGTVYEYGAFLLMLIEEKVGRETFDAVFAEYYETTRQTPVDTAAFVAFFEEKTGTPLRDFADKWIYRLPSTAEVRAEVDRFLAAH